MGVLRLTILTSSLGGDFQSVPIADQLPPVNLFKIDTVLKVNPQTLL